MSRTISLSVALALLFSANLLADFSYEQSTRITGGLLQKMSFLSRQLREPVRTQVSVKGDRMAMVVPGTSANIIDLSKETITEIDFKKKTYSVVTFAQMAQALKEAEAKLKSEKGDKQMDIQMKPSVKETGQTRDINGVTARQFVVTIEFEGTNPDTKERGVFMTFISDTWVAPAVAGYSEVKSFYERMAQKLSWLPGMVPMAGGAETSRAMAEAYKEFAKMDGVPLLQVSKMAMGPAANVPPGQPAAAQPEQPQQQQQAEAPRGIGGALGRLGGGRFGLGRRAQQEEQPAQQQQQQPGGTPSMMELTTELSNFSASAVADSTFEVPAGFKQVESETVKAIQRGR
ncbi:MAG: hypothetical protein ACM3S5_12045 [Rhodospirillales bacterium]